MKQIRTSVLLLLALACLLTAVSCGRSGDQTSYTDTSAESSDSADTVSVTTAPPIPELLLTLVENGKSNFEIIYPEGAGAALMTEISELTSTIRTYTGATLFYSDDFTRKTPEELSAKPEILIGTTNRAETARHISTDTLNYGDYVITIEGNKLIIGGLTETSTVAAIRYFINTSLYKNDTLTKGNKNGTLVLNNENTYRFERNVTIKEMTVDGVPFSKFAIVVPDQGYVEDYIARLLVKHIAILHGIYLPVLPESEAGERAHVIRIGKMARTTTEAEQNTYRIHVTDGNIEVVSHTVFGYLRAYDTLCNDLLRAGAGRLHLKSGDGRSGTELAPSEIWDRGDLRIMYHNIWGYLNTDSSNPVSMRADIAIPIYEEVAPDILCFEEAGSKFRTSAKNLFNWLKNAGYSEICFGNEGGTGNPIFYRKDLLEVVDSGYAKARNGDKGTTWAVFRLKADPTKTFAVTNSHFAANSNAGGDATLGNTYRVQDAKAMVEALTTIRNTYRDIPVFSGGDFNTSPSGAPYRVLTDAGLTNVLQLTDNKSTVKPFHGSYAYDRDFDLYEPANAAAANTSASSIDHIMAIPNGAAIRQYFVLTDRLSATVSDHCPHFADVDLPT